MINSVAGKRRGRKSPQPATDAPPRPNSIVEAAYSAAMFKDRGAQRDLEAEATEAECQAG